MFPTSALAFLLATLVALAGRALADTENTHGGFLQMCDRNTIRICSTMPERDAGNIDLCASCYNDSTKRLDYKVASRLDLGQCLANTIGKLTWRNK